MMSTWVAAVSGCFSGGTRGELTKLNGNDGDGNPAFVNLLSAASLVTFVSLGVAQAISIRTSVGAGGTIHYDASSAVTVAEFLKLFFSMSWLFLFNRDSIPSAKDIPVGWLYESATLLLVAVFFAIQNQFAFLVVEKLGPSLFVILGNLKIVFTCIFMRLMLGTRFSILQWIAVAMLTLSAMILKFPVLLQVKQGSPDDDVHDLLTGFALMLLSTSSSGLSSVTNELVLKRSTEGPQMPFMAKNAVLYTWGFGINFLVWYMMGALPFFAWVEGHGLFPILCMTGMGLACSVVLRYLDNMYRCFAACAQILLTVTLARFVLPAALQEEPFGIFYACSLLMLAQAIVIYQNHESPRLFWHVATASVGTMLVCLLCVALDKYHTAP